MQYGAIGCTPYNTQSEDDIKKDLEIWVDKAARTKRALLIKRAEALQNGFWKKVGLEFKNVVASSINYCDTIIHDLNKIIDAIEQDKIGEREIRLLESIGNEACNYNEQKYPKSIEGKENANWQLYEKPDFAEIEEMYIIGRDFFGTLEDALNAATRLKDYIESNNHTTVVVVSENERKIPTTQDVLDDILKVGDGLCCNKTYNSKSEEDRINDYVRDVLSQKYPEIRDQTRHGSSSSGKGPGEIDLLLLVKGKEVALYEAMVLDGINNSYTKNHIDKAVTSYNPLGTASFVVVYYKGDDYETFWNNYLNSIMNYVFPQNIVKKSVVTELLPQRNASTHVAQVEISKGNYSFPVYFITWELQK